MLDSNHLVRNREGFLFWLVIYHLSKGENGTVGMLKEPCAVYKAEGPSKELMSKSIKVGSGELKPLQGILDKRVETELAGRRK